MLLLTLVMVDMQATPAEPKDEPMPDSAAAGEASSAPAADEVVDDKSSAKTDGTQPIPTDNGAAPMDTDAAPVVNEPETEVVKKKRALKHAVNFTVQHAGPSAKDLSVGT